MRSLPNTKFFRNHESMGEKPSCSFLEMPAKRSDRREKTLTM